MRYALIITMPVMAAGCASMAPSASEGVDTVSNQSAAAITYYLPKTKVTLTVNAVLKSCGYAPTATPTVLMAAVAEADDKPFTISGPILQSWRLKRDLDITLTDQGTIAAINSTIADRTASIIGGIVKFAASLVIPLQGSAAAPTTAYECTPATQRAIDEVVLLESRIAAVRAAMAKQTPAEIKTSVELVDALAARIAALRTGPLMLTVTRVLSLSAPASDVPIELTDKDLAKWFELPATTPSARIAAARPNFPGMSDAEVDSQLRAQVPTFRMTYTLAAVDAGQTPSATAAAAALAPGCPGDTECAKTLVFREPVPAKLTVYAGDGYAGLDSTKVYEGIIPVAQWGTPSYLSLGTKLLQSRTVNLTFDGFGRKKSFAWKSEAKGEALAGALGTTADSVGAFRKALADKTETELNAALVTDLETKQKLNSLLACKEILDAGGFTCPGAE